MNMFQVLVPLVLAQTMGSKIVPVAYLISTRYCLFKKNCCSFRGFPPIVNIFAFMFRFMNMH